jgi:hypothetical protein
MRRAIAAAALAAWTTGSAWAEVLYFDFNSNEVGTRNRGARGSVLLVGEPGQTATIGSLAGFSESVVLDSRGFYELQVPSSHQQSGIGVWSSGFQVASPKPIAGYFINRRMFSTDMTYLLDSRALGTDYVIASFGAGYGEGGQVPIQATADGTAVVFTPRGAAPISVTLNAGETYTHAGEDRNLSGSRVTASAPVAVFAGHECAEVPSSRWACDTLLEQMIPNNALSTSYAVASSRPAADPRVGFDLMRVIATAPGTAVSVDGVPVATLDVGQSHLFPLAGGTGASITSSAPVMVAQYLIGTYSDVLTDPSMALVPGRDVSSPVKLTSRT